MSSQATEERTHPLHWFAGRLHEVLDDLGDPSTWSMADDDVIETLMDLTAGMARLQAHQHAVITEADRRDVATRAGAVNAAALLRSTTRDAAPVRTVRLAKALDQHPATRAALLSGLVNLDQAREITTAVDALPSAVGVEDRLRAAEHLLAEARVHDALELRRLGKHLVDVIDPDHADKRLAKALEAEERRAARRTYLTVSDDGDGRFRIPRLHVAMLRKGLEALLSPARPEPIDTNGRPRDEVLGEAFCQLLARKVNATVVVTLPLDTLLGGIKAAHLDTGQPISPGLARRLACAAGVIPAVLGSRSEVLDLGRKVRLHTPKHRLAMNVQQGGTCAVEDCNRPASWGDAHHLVLWSEGGETTVADGVLVCPRHHTLAHLPRYQLQRVQPGRVRLVRRQ